MGFFTRFSLNLLNINHIHEECSKKISEDLIKITVTSSTLIIARK